MTMRRAIALGLLSIILGGASLSRGVWAQTIPVTTPPSSPNDLGEPLVPLPQWPPDVFPEDDGLWGPEPVAVRSRLLSALNYSLQYLATPEAQMAYRDYPVPGITHERVRQSVLRFRSLLLLSPSPDAFYRAIQREFVLYQSIGHDRLGTVHFTGYFEPSFQASRTRTEEYRYPLYRRPLDLEAWQQPHPSRMMLEGSDGLQGHQGPLRGLELVWLRDRLEAFLVQVQGSARLQLTDGTWMSVGYAGRTEYDYTSIGQELVKDGKIPAAELTLDRLQAYFQAHPSDLDVYIPRNQRFIFFQETHGGPPTGTFSVPVTAGRSIATDKTLMPPGAIALITLDWPQPDASGDWQRQPISRYVLNQDTGGAIQGAGRVDIFVGSGFTAGEQAGRINTEGQLFYLLLDSGAY